MLYPVVAIRNEIATILCGRCGDPVLSKSFVLLVGSDADDDSAIMEDPAASGDAVMVDATHSL